jgi:hypothetical protein
VNGSTTFSEGTYSFVGTTTVVDTAATEDDTCLVNVPGASSSNTVGFQLHLTQNQKESATVMGTFTVASGGSTQISISCSPAGTTSGTTYLVTRIGSSTL